MVKIVYQVTIPYNVHLSQNSISDKHSIAFWCSTNCSMQSSSTIHDVMEMEHVCTLDCIEKSLGLYLMTTHIFQKQEKTKMFVMTYERTTFAAYVLEEGSKVVKGVLLQHLISKWDVCRKNISLTYFL